jgi:hypothetical protein
VNELFASLPDGGDNVAVSGFPVPGGEVRAFQWAPGASRLVYRADQLVDERFELFVAAPDGGAVNASISGALTDGGDVFSFGTR